MTDSNEPEVGATSDNSNMPQTGTADKSSQSAWEGFSDEETKYVGDKGWKAPKDLLKSYRELENMESKRISIPADDDAEAWNKLYAKLGRPETADKYDIGVNDNDKAEIQKLMFETNQTSKQAKALVAGFDKLIKEKQKAADALIDAENKKQEESVIAEWGDDAEKNTELMNRGAKLLGLDDEDLAAVRMTIAPKKYMEAMKRLGEAISEDNIPAGNKGGHEEKVSFFSIAHEIMKGKDNG